MKRFAFAAALAVFAVSLSFGDDANVLPGGVVRLRVIPSITTFNQVFDKDGAAQDASPSASLTILSAALEFGFTDQITGGLKWAPGYYLGATFDKLPTLLQSNKKMVLSGADDLELGAKIEVVGTKGFVASDILRVALTPGLSLPLSAYDGSEQGKNFAYGKEYQAQAASSHGSLGGGLKADLDYLISEAFYVNVHAQALQYLPNESISFLTGSTYWGNYAGAIALGAPESAAKAAAEAAAPLTNTKTTYGLEYTIEVEPHYTIDLGGDMNIGIGVPVTYAAAGETKTEYNGTSKTAEASYVASIKPYVTFFTLIGPLPVELQVEYDKDLAGKNEASKGTFLAQLKLFYKFY